MPSFSTLRSDVRTNGQLFSKCRRSSAVMEPRVGFLDKVSDVALIKRVRQRTLQYPTTQESFNEQKVFYLMSDILVISIAYS